MAACAMRALSVLLLTHTQAAAHGRSSAAMFIARAPLPHWYRHANPPPLSDHGVFAVGRAVDSELGGTDSGPCDFVSRSTATDDDAVFVTNSTVRRARLDAALVALGVDVAPLNEDPMLAGTPALRAYRSFILPKSERALAVAESPQRAITVAAQISFGLREAAAHRADWLRNHDRGLAEAAAARGGAPRAPLALVLDGLRSGENVGSILRTAEAGGIDRVVGCGTTPAPPHPSVLRAACGAAAHVRHEHAPSAVMAIEQLRAEGFAVWALETAAGAAPLASRALAPLPSPLALVLGNELVGVGAEALAACDRVVMLPTFGVKNSLNVAAAASAAVYEVLRQWDYLEA